MARDALDSLDGLQVVGGAISPVSDAYMKPGLAQAVHRLHMCRLAAADSEWICVDGWEAEQPGYTCTLQVLQSVKARIGEHVPNVHVMLLAGSDLVKSFQVPDLWSTEDVRQAHATRRTYCH